MKEDGAASGAGLQWATLLLHFTYCFLPLFLDTTFSGLECVRFMQVKHLRTGFLFNCGFFWFIQAVPIRIAPN